jgi:hypothetical protein
MVKKPNNVRKRKIYTSDDIKKSAQIYFISGNMVKTSEITQVPRTTLQGWNENKLEWVQETVRVRHEILEELDAHFTQIIEQSVIEAKDRVQNGDEFFDPKTGKMYRKKMSGKDLATVGGISFDKQRLLRGLPTSNVQTSSDEQLKKLAEIFEEIAKKDCTNAIDGEVKRVDD